MNTWVAIARYHLVQRVSYVIAPWTITGFVLAVILAVFAMIPATHGGYVGSVAIMYATFFALGIMSIGRSLPFGLALGLSRRSYYTGTALLALVLAAVYGLALALLQVVERATGGWGIALHFFRVPYVLSGPWYLTWLTSFVGLALLYVYGMWFGIVYHRWSRFGLVTFGVLQTVALLAGALVITWASAWSSVGHFFTELTAAGLTGVLAALVAVLLAGGYVTIRRATV